MFDEFPVGVLRFLIVIAMIIVHVVCAFLCNSLEKDNGREGESAIVLGLLLGFFGVIYCGLRRSEDEIAYTQSWIRENTEYSDEETEEDDEEYYETEVRKPKKRSPRSKRR